MTTTLTLDQAREALAAALRAHAPVDALEASHRDRILRLVTEVPGCFARSTYSPGHVTGSAFVVCRATREVLLHRHKKLDRWLQMGGHDDGELDPRKTALREGAEESGLADLTLLEARILDVDVHDIPASPARDGGRKPAEPAHEHHDVRYVLFTESREAIEKDPEESSALAWFSLEEADRRMNEVGSTRALRKIAALL